MQLGQFCYSLAKIVDLVITTKWEQNQYVIPSRFTSDRMTIK